MEQDKKNRSKNEEIINVDPKKEIILDAINSVKNKKFSKRNLFGYVENTTEKFLNILKNSDIWNISIQKQFIDMKDTKSK